MEHASTGWATAAIGLTLGGIPAVLCAAYLVKELPLEIVRALVVIIVIYTAITLLIARADNSDRSRSSHLLQGGIPFLFPKLESEI